MNEKPSAASPTATPDSAERPLPDPVAGSPASSASEPTATPPATPSPGGDRRTIERRSTEIERETRRRESRRWLFAIVVLALAGAIWWVHQNVEAQRSVIDTQARELTATRVALAETQRDLKAAQQRFAEIEERIEQVRAQRAALDQLYTDISRGRDDSILIEVERLISLAAQELQITGNVATAIAALQSADTRLARLERPQFVALRRALARDVEKLRALPVVDATGIALRLDQLTQGIDAWPMVAQATSAAPGAAGAGATATAQAATTPTQGAATGPAPKTPAPKAATKGKDGKEAPAAAPPPASEASVWARLRNWVTREFGELIRIHEATAPEALLVTEAQQQLLRQQLRLRLLDARYAALARNERVFRADVDDVQALLNKYFDTRAPAVSQALAQLKQLGQAPLAVEAPALSESTAALRALTGRR